MVCCSWTCTHSRVHLRLVICEKSILKVLFFSTPSPTSVQLIMQYSSCRICRLHRHSHEYVFDLSIMSSEFCLPSLLCLYYPALIRAFFSLLSCGINSHCLKVLITSAMHGLACRYSSLPQLRKTATSDCANCESLIFLPKRVFTLPL